VALSRVTWRHERVTRRVNCLGVVFVLGVWGVGLIGWVDSAGGFGVVETLCDEEKHCSGPSADSHPDKWHSRLTKSQTHLTQPPLGRLGAGMIAPTPLAVRCKCSLAARAAAMDCHASASAFGFVVGF